MWGIYSNVYRVLTFFSTTVREHYSNVGNIYIGVRIYTHPKLRLFPTREHNDGVIVAKALIRAPDSTKVDL